MSYVDISFEKSNVKGCFGRPNIRKRQEFHYQEMTISKYKGKIKLESEI